MAGHSDGGGKSASFEGAGGVKAFVFDEDVGVFAAAQHGGEPFAERDRRGFRKYCIVAPHRRNERQQRCRRKSFFDGGEVVARIKNSTIFRANGLRTIGILLASRVAPLITLQRSLPLLAILSFANVSIRLQPLFRFLHRSTLPILVGRLQQPQQQHR